MSYLKPLMCLGVNVLHQIIVELDALLDTRSGCLSQIDPDEALRLLAVGFCSRKSEDLTAFNSSISNEAYKAAYSKRDVFTLAESRLSSYIFELKSQIETFIQDRSDDQSRIEQLVVWINSYPYDLDEDEKLDILAAIDTHTQVTERYEGLVKLKLEPIKPDELKLKWLKDNKVYTYVTPDITEWFNTIMYKNRLRDDLIPYPQLTLIAPKLLREHNILDGLENSVKHILEKQSPFDFIKTAFSPVVGIEFCPIELMSLIDVGIVTEPNQSTSSD